MQESITGNTSAKTIGEIVAADFRIARIFENHGIDFCCGGQNSLATTCTKNGLDLITITKELEAVKSEPAEYRLPGKAPPFSPV